MSNECAASIKSNHYANHPNRVIDSCSERTQSNQGIEAASALFLRSASCALLVAFMASCHDERLLLKLQKYVIQLVGPSRPYYDVSNVCRDVATLFLIDLTFTLASRQFLSLRFSSSSLRRFFVKV